MPGSFNQWRPSRGYRSRPSDRYYMLTLPGNRCGGEYRTIGDMRRVVHREWREAQAKGESYPVHEVIATCRWKASYTPHKKYIWLIGDAGPYARVDRDWPPQYESDWADAPDPERETASAYVERLQANAGEWKADTRDDGDEESGLL